MNGEEIEIETAEGRIPTHVYHPTEGEGPWPAVVYLMDGMGIRPTLLASAERLAQDGYYVLVPDLFYRSGDYAPLDHSTLQDDPEQQARVMEMVALVTNEGVLHDIEAFLAFFEARPEARSDRIACVGYCLGGPLALYAAGHLPDRVAVAASIHGANLATDREDSPHLVADQIRGEVYLAVAEFDPYIQPGETERIDEALREAGTRYTLEHYPGCHHGFALVGAHGYDAEADERHRRRLLALFEKHLAA
jgi:carboxymethylenebutenolidase